MVCTSEGLCLNLKSALKIPKRFVQPGRDFTTAFVNTQLTFWNVFSSCVSHCTCLHTRVNSVDTLSLGHIGRRDTLCCGSPPPPSLWQARCCIQIPLESCPLLCPTLFFFFPEFIFDEMIPGAKAYKVQLGGDRLAGV